MTDELSVNATLAAAGQQREDASAMGQTTTVPKGRELLKTWLSGEHPAAAICPAAECGLNVTTIGIPSLAYTFETCTCDAWDYPHIVEQLWHRDCLVDS